MSESKLPQPSTKLQTSSDASPVVSATGGGGGGGGRVAREGKAREKQLFLFLISRDSLWIGIGKLTSFVPSLLPRRKSFLKETSD